MSEFIQIYKKDQFVGHLSNPITTSSLTTVILKNLPAYRAGTSSIMRGLEIGMAHGYFLLGPFTSLGPLRNSDISNLAGFLSSIGLISILGIALFSYSYVSFNSLEKENKLISKKDWNKFSGSFVIGAFGGSLFGFFLLSYF